MKFFAAILLALSFAVAADSTRTLHISTWPSKAEIYSGTRPDDFKTKADKESPDTLIIAPNDSIIRITLFKYGYSDTTMDIHLRAPKDNYIWIVLKEEPDMAKFDIQQEVFNTRNRQAKGKILFFGSFIPLALSGTLAGLAQLEFNKAERDKDKIESSTIQSGQKFENFEDRFQKERDNGRDLKKGAAISLGIGFIMLAASAIFYF
ncbi:MAG: hypothetical protein M0P13_03685 [Fibrobacteraceae bacterium]|nr:hypothetical protein [Fibrobacteraceae bacterium]